MNKYCMLPLFLLGVVSLAPGAHALEFDAVTLFACEEDGTQISSARWNTGPRLDSLWEIFMYEGDVVENADQARWMNDPKTGELTFAPGEGSTTYTFHIDCTAHFQRFGLNLFAAGESVPFLSVHAPLTHDASRPAEVKVNSSKNTMGWPSTTVPAAGSATADGLYDGSLWRHGEFSGWKKYTLTDFKLLSPKAAEGINFVGPSLAEPSKNPDYIGQFTILVENVDPEPPDWLLWTTSVAAMKIGPNNRDGTWKQTYDSGNAQPPFSFTYGGRSSRDFLKGWKFDVEHKRVDANRIAHNLTWLDPDTGLQVLWEGLEYTDFESIEWTIYLTNTGESDTPIIEDLQALDTDFFRPTGDQEFHLRHWSGSFATANDFAPKNTVLEAGKKLSFQPAGGRPTGGHWPYYNLEVGDEGVIIVVGWSGQWHSKFTRDDTNGLHISAGQSKTHFKLLPGEKVRTPLIVMQFWKGGDWIDAQNSWRRWMIKHNVPRPDGGELPLPQFAACSSHQFSEMSAANEQNQIEFLDSYLDKGLKLDYWWMDAGWYVGTTERGWPFTGTWEVDRRPHRFPNGLRAISDHAHKRGVKIIVWFEPERVADKTWLSTEHPEWVLGGTKGGLLNMGDPDAWNWVVNHISKMITEEGVDLYRQDYNIYPLSWWENNDSEDRQGITENKYVMGYLAYFDALLQRHPGLRIDGCASGGNRLDLETLRRSVVLTKSDYLFEPVGQQGHTYGISFWVPYHGTGYSPSNTAGWGWGTGGLSYDRYPRRSNMCPANTGCFDFRVPVNDALIQKLHQEWLEIGPNYFGDYYPLTDYNLSQKEWIAWQFHRPGEGEGFVQAFRREQCIYRMAEVKLRGLDPNATYQLKNYDVEAQVQVSGRQLMEEGLFVGIPEKPGAVTIRYVEVR
jgi:alpha-galactosidase